jgi:hypothetical protein
MSAIQDPFDPSEAIMPSGNRGSKLYIAPIGTDPFAPLEDSRSEWKQLGWVEPDAFNGRDPEIPIEVKPADTPNEQG